MVDAAQVQNALAQLIDQVGRLTTTVQQQQQTITDQSQNMAQAQQQHAAAAAATQQIAAQLQATQQTIAQMAQAQTPTQTGTGAQGFQWTWHATKRADDHWQYVRRHGNTVHFGQIGKAGEICSRQNGLYNVGVQFSGLLRDGQR